MPPGTGSRGGKKYLMITEIIQLLDLARQRKIVATGEHDAELLIMAVIQ
jgi:hypothetical protein